MNLAVKRMMLAAWLLGATAFLALLWLTYPELGPRIPAVLSLRLVELYGATNGEELRDLETLLALGSAFAVMLMLTFPGLFVWRRNGRWTSGS